MTIKRHKVIKNFDFSIAFCDLESVNRVKVTLNLIHLNELCTHLSASSMTISGTKSLKILTFHLAFASLKWVMGFFNDLKSVIRINISDSLIHLNKLCTHLSASSMTLKRHKVINNVDLSLGLCKLKLGHVIFQRPHKYKCYGDEPERLLDPSQ